jgi:hypothetical protein
MFAMLLKRLALAGLMLMIGATLLDRFDPSPAPLLVHSGGVAAALPDLLAAALEPEKPAISHPSPYLIDGSTVVEVFCSDHSMGSAVYLGSGLYVTAAHVLMDEQGKLSIKCWIFGQRVAIAQINETADYAFVRADHFPPFHAPISCDRLKGGEIYFASGYASGNPWLITSMIRASGISEAPVGEEAGTADINGALVNGMSGGSVADRDGFVHAINDWREEDGAPTGGVVELADTPLCKGKK